jgi:hypothetical protein
MSEDSFFDSFMESHIGGWTADTERMYDEEAEHYDDYHRDNYPPDDDEYDDTSYDEDDERMENADLDFDQSDW